MSTIDISSAVSGYDRTAASARLLMVMPQCQWSLGAGVCPAPIEPQPGGHLAIGAVANGGSPVTGGSAAATRHLQLHVSIRQFEKYPTGFPDLRPPA